MGLGPIEVAGGVSVRDLERPLILWAVSDDKIGNINQVVGLGEAVARRRPAQLVVKTLTGLSPLPWYLNPYPAAPYDIGPPWPDIWIGAGRASVALSMAVRRWSRRATFVVQLQDPRAPVRAFDLVIPPLHDQVAGGSAFPIVGSPHRVTAEQLHASGVRFAEHISPLPHPRVAVLIGGKSKAHDLTPERADVLGRDIARAVSTCGGSVLVTYSRRTSAEAQTTLTARLEDLPGIIWDGTGSNPYFAFLGAADHILATEDSTNLAVEAAATGKPLQILSLDGGSTKFRRFHRDLERMGVSRPFLGVLETWRYIPLAETDRAGDEVLRRYEDRR